VRQKRRARNLLGQRTRPGACWFGSDARAGETGLARVHLGRESVGRSPGGPIGKDVAQMRLGEDHQVIAALAADAPRNHSHTDFMSGA